MGPLIHGVFSIVNIEVLHDLRLVKSADTGEPQMWRNCGYKGLTVSYTQSFERGGSAPLIPTLFKGQPYYGSQEYHFLLIPRFCKSGLSPFSLVTTSAVLHESRT